MLDRVIGKLRFTQMPSDGVQNDTIYLDAMNTINISRHPNNIDGLVKIFIGFCIAMLFLTAVAEAQIDGFTEPFRSIQLSSDESGSIAELNIEEGEFVPSGQVIARLDVRVQEMQLEIATHLANTQSQLIAAEETLRKRQAIAKRLVELKAKGHASQSEIIRAEMELSIAKAKFLAAGEEQAVRAIEQRRAQVQLDRRKIVSPIDGLVAEIHRREGEFLSPLHPEVATIIQVDRLLATFAIPSSQISSFEIGKDFNLQLEGGRTISGKVFRIGVQTDAQSGTVEVKIVIENPSRELRAGEICTLNI
ncbi:MAG: efflux RND transporter periplasmic adaptor subunit [Mariniblastus sp.]|nr:efflux RND transporter periplasmic adaptor subunit [Mariniblastus sp.]